MPAQSARVLLDPAKREQLDGKLDFVRKNRGRYHGFMRSVAEATGYTSANIYSVINGNSFNSSVIEEAYNQVCRCMGILDDSVLADTGNPDDDKAVAYLAKSTQLRADLESDLRDARTMLLRIKRKTKDLQILDGTLELHLRYNLEDLSDMVATQVREYLRSNYDRPVHEVALNAPDLEEIDPAILEAMAVLKSTGALTSQGFLKEDNETESEIGIGHNITDLLPDPA